MKDSTLHHLSRNLLLSCLACLTWALTSCRAPQPESAVLEDELQQLVQLENMEVGVAAILNGQDTVVVNNAAGYPMLSVFKYHQALAVVHALAACHTPLDTLIYIPKAELQMDTYSPMRDKYPQGDFSLSVRELLEYTLLLSDNNACDILFDHVSDIGQTARYLQSLGNHDFALKVSEKEMNQSPEAYLKNWSTPLSAVFFLERLLDGSVVQGEYQQFLLDTMMRCTTGYKRLPAFTGKSQCRMGHKTGTGGMSLDGQLQAVNDIGFVYLPDGRYYTLAVFIKNSKKSMADTEAVIAAVSEKVYQYMLSHP